jgi:hypothetical protein
MRKCNETINFMVMRFSCFHGVKGILRAEGRGECEAEDDAEYLCYAGFFSEYHNGEECISGQKCLTWAYTFCANYLTGAFVAYMARVGNGIHLFAVATKSVSKKFVSLS